MTESIFPLTIPKLGLTMKMGTIAAWHVKPSDEVTEGKPVADIESEKITSEYDAPISGILRRQVASAGQTLPVGALIGVVASADIPDAEIDAFVAGYKPEQKA
jgi:pyruvate dehydrogenase E2 component (dihydrolipoamide acetyltransferase)